MMNTSYDRFMRTTDEYHEKQVQKMFRKMYDKGDIYKGYYEGWYCTPCESFFTETQLKDGKCPDCGRDVELLKEESYFFKLSKYGDRIIKYYEENPEFLQPNTRQNEMIANFLKPGLEDLCVSRITFLSTPATVSGITSRSPRTQARRALKRAKSPPGFTCTKISASFAVSDSRISTTITVRFPLPSSRNAPVEKVE